MNTLENIYLLSEGTKSVLLNNYKQKGKKKLSSFTKVHITDSVISKYKKEYPFLKHVRYKDTKEYICDGYIWFDNDKLVAMVGSCEYTDDKTKWVVSLEITKEYQGYGLSKQILDYAVKTMNCKYLSVNKNNEIAKKVYDDYGFKVYQQSDTMYYMTLDNSLRKAIKEECLNNCIKEEKTMSAPETIESLFESALLKEDDVDNVVDDDLEDMVIDHLEENRKISIFDNEYLLEGEMNNE